MVTAIVLLNVERGEINAVAEKLVDIEGVSEVYSVSGRYVPRNEDMAAIVTEYIRKIEGIQRTETMLAFRSYSRHDLEAMFSIGL
jgi:DNA-binding Lrp family transcriptional regulator